MTDEELFTALAEVRRLLDRGTQRVQQVAARTQELRAGRKRGASYAELLTGAHEPLVIDVLSDLLQGLFAAGSRLRRAEARALHAEGLSMDKIGQLLGVSRQRVSVLINSPMGRENHASAPQERIRAAGLSLTGPEFRMIAEALPHLVWVASSEGATEYFNRQGTDYTGVPRETNYDWNWVTLVHPEDQDRALTAWRLAVASGTDFDLDYRIRRFDGEYRWHRFRSLPIRRDDDRIVKWIGTATDIHEQRELENELRQARLRLGEQ
jgi:PAS domain S-box-containing protein